MFTRPLFLKRKENKMTEQQTEKTNQNKNRIRTRRLVECAAMVALGTVLSLIKIPVGHLGGSIKLLSALPHVYV